MSAIDLDLPHKCVHDKAIACIDTWLRALGQEHGRRIDAASVTWKGDMADLQLGLPTPLGKIEVSGTLKVDASRFRLQAKLPWKVAAFKGKIESVIRDALAAKCRDCPG
ncbi:MAG: polyhydroxyalkanoic acid system family protein [Planctomycetota bacterium]|nr:polyhydroxyalkanoic acid system family protein [Planctomycetota bacterium]